MPSSWQVVGWFVTELWHTLLAFDIFCQLFFFHAAIPRAPSLVVFVQNVTTPLIVTYA